MDCIDSGKPMRRIPASLLVLSLESVQLRSAQAVAKPSSGQEAAQIMPGIRPNWAHQAIDWAMDYLYA